MADEEAGQSVDLKRLTAEIVVAHASHNHLSAADLVQLIGRTYEALSSLRDAPVTAPDVQKPAVPIRSSVKEDYIVCLEDGARLKMLKRYLRTRFELTPEQYRAKWGLPADYPMVAPAYAARRREVASTIGLGQKIKREPTPEPAKPARPRKGTLKLALNKARDHLTGS